MSNNPFLLFIDFWQAFLGQPLGKIENLPNHIADPKQKIESAQILPLKQVRR